MFDYLIVGAGFAGCVLAERLAAGSGQKILLCDRRPHLGGNAHDCHDAAGILVHKYGPHIFHTNSPAVFSYLSRFTEWRPYEHRVLASVEGQLLPIPINLDTVNRLYGTSYDSAELADHFEQVRDRGRVVRSAEDLVLSTIGRDLYEKFFRGYTKKQWGLDPAELDASVTARIPTRTNTDDRYFTDRYQAMPKGGYTKMFEKMIDHPNIELLLETDYQRIKKTVSHRQTIYTGPIDAYFDHIYGRLPYRSIEFRHENVEVARFQPVGTVNYPNEHAFTRITEFKHLTGQAHARTSVVYEYPNAEGEPYYPVPRRQNAELYARYRKLALRQKDALFVGRLATYRYYNMDQVVAQALKTYQRLARRHAPGTTTELPSINA